MKDNLEPREEKMRKVHSLQAQQMCISHLPDILMVSTPVQNNSIEWYQQRSKRKRCLGINIEQVETKELA